MSQETGLNVHTFAWVIFNFIPNFQILRTIIRQESSRQTIQPIPCLFFFIIITTALFTRSSN